MAFTKKFRTDFPDDLQKRFRCYWHVMHPVTFDPSKIYRIGWTDETWDAWHLIHKTRKEVLKDGFRWSYEWDWTEILGRPWWMPPIATLTWACEDDYPSIAVQENELPELQQQEMREWIYEAYRYRMLGQMLHDQLSHMLQINYEYSQRGYGRHITSETSLVNTPAQMLAIWPELVSFLPPEERDVMRHRHMKFAAPRDWSDDDQTAFHAKPEMAEISHALQTMALIPETLDRDYPALTE